MLSDNAKMTHRMPKKAWTKYYTDKQKLEAVKLYLITGNISATAAALNITRQTVQAWVHTQWFKDLAKQIKNEGRIALSHKMRTIAEKAMDISLDRLEKGDWIYDQKTGELSRKPVNLRDAHKVATEFLNKSQQLDEKEDRNESDDQIAGRLDVLANAFAQFARKTTKIEVLDVEGVVNALSDEREKGLQEGRRLGQLASGQEEGKSGENGGQTESSSGQSDNEARQEADRSHQTAVEGGL